MVAATGAMLLIAFLLTITVSTVAGWCSFTIYNLWKICIIIGLSVATVSKLLS
jgi:hypothetical protein